MNCDSLQLIHGEEFAAKRILIVGDDPIIQKVLTRLFASEGYSVVVRSGGRAALEAFRSSTPSAIILDLALPLMSGQDICREIRQESAVPIVIVSAAANVPDKVRLLELGADDYVTKPFNPRELLARVRAIIRYASKSDDHIATFDGVWVDFAKMEVTLDRKPVQLTLNEFKLLKFFLRREGRVVSREEVLKDVLGHDDGSCSRVLNTYISKLRRKLERDPANPIHLRTIRGVGYRFVR